MVTDLTFFARGPITGPRKTKSSANNAGEGLARYSFERRIRSSEVSAFNSDECSRTELVLGVDKNATVIVAI